MSVFTSIEIFIFSIIILVFLQLIPGIFALLIHTLLGKFSRARAESTALFFILGTETALAVAILLIYFLLNTSGTVFDFFQSPFFTWLIVCLLIILGLLFMLGYFRRGPGTELFISRKFQARYLEKVNAARTRLDAFLLGFTAPIPELIFTAPLLLLSIMAISELGADGMTRASLIILFILLVISPLIVIYIFFSHHNTLADFLRFRFKNKTFVRFLVPFLYFLIAIIMILGISL